MRLPCFASARLRGTGTVHRLCDLVLDFRWKRLSLEHVGTAFAFSDPSVFWYLLSTRHAAAKFCDLSGPRPSPPV